jgi:rod shape-determining protein MreC
VIFSLVSMALMVVDHRFHHLESVRAGLKVMVYPVQYVVALPFHASTWLDEEISTQRQLLEHNRALQKEQLVLRATLQKFSSLEQENRRLRDLLGASERLRDRVSIAELLAVDLDPYRQEILINKGERDGVFVGQPLVDAHGIMGQVVRVDRSSATAMLISDPSHALPVQVNRTGLRTLAVGTGNPQILELRHIPPSADIEHGDVISTSGLGRRFPANYPVGEIVRVERPPGRHFAIVEARPLANLDRSRELLLVWSQTPGEDSASVTVEAVDRE